MGCLKIPAEYNAKHGIHPKDVVNPKKKPRVEIVSGAVTLAHNLSSLSNLLSPKFLDREVADLEVGLRTITIQIWVYGHFLRVPVPYHWVLIYFSLHPVIIRS
jgi:hypothetical protein